MEWISVEKYLPGKKVEWVIVRCVNSDLYEFYFMASFCINEWSYFDDNQEYEKNMRITHWAIPDKVKEKDYFIEEDGSIVNEKNI